MFCIRSVWYNLDNIMLRLADIKVLDYKMYQ